MVFFSGVDPVKVGMIGSLNHPGGNLKELVLSARTIAYLGSPFQYELEKDPLQGAAQVLGLRLLSLSARNADGFEDAFGAMATERVDGPLVGSDAVLQPNSDRIADLAARPASPRSMSAASPCWRVV